MPHPSVLSYRGLGRGLSLIETLKRHKDVTLLAREFECQSI